MKTRRSASWSFFLYAEIAAAHYEADEAIKQKKFDDLKKETLPFYLDKLDAAAKENNGYLALGRVSFSIMLSTLSALFFDN